MVLYANVCIVCNVRTAAPGVTVASSLNNFDFLKQQKLSAGATNIGSSVDLTARQSNMKYALLKTRQT